MSKPKSDEKCYLCGSTENLTRDHIPPKCLFSKPRPGNLYTVPCCYRCNNSASKEDEYLRLATSGLLNAHAKGKLAFDRVVESTLPKRRIGKLIDELRAGIEPIVVKTPQEDISASRIPVDAPTICRSVVRITKGILAATHPEVDTSGFDFEISHIDQFKRDSLVTSGVAGRFTQWSVGEGVYQNWRAVSAEDAQRGVMVHSFYGAAIWTVKYQPGEGVITLTTHPGWSQAAPGSPVDLGEGEGSDSTS